MSGGSDPHILKDWYYMEVSGQLHTLDALLVGKVLLLPTEQQGCTGSLPTCQESNPDYSVV